MNTRHAIIFATIILAGGCTPKYGISNAQAFVRESVSGTVKVDNNGRPVNSAVSKTHLIYVETSPSEPLPQWEQAWVDGKGYSIKTVQVLNANQTIGKTADDKEVSVIARPGNQLWQLVLSPQTELTPDAAMKEKMQANAIVLTGKWKDKQFEYKIEKEQPLATIHMQ
jgi:hypothetical protein